MLYIKPSIIPQVPFRKPILTKRMFRVIPRGRSLIMGVMA